MTIEDFALRFEGLDPVKVKEILDNVQHFINLITTELPRIDKTLKAINSQIAAYEANQRRFGG